MFRLLFRNVFQYYNRTALHRTEIFSSLTNKQLATPELTRALVRKRLPFHSRMSQTHLYHGKRVRHAIKSCFSEKKSKKFKRVNKIMRVYFSKILNQNLRITMSMKAFRCIRKMGSFDNYILVTKPKDLDSKFGEYLRELMLRKINDPEYRLPYVLRTGRKQRVRKYYRYLYNKEQQKFVIPKEFKKNFETFQRKFGSSVDELNNEDYKKYLELEKLKKTSGYEVAPNHPLLLELNEKLQRRLTPEEEAKLDEMSQHYKNEYLNHPKNTQKRREKYEKLEKLNELTELKIKEAFIKFNSTGPKE